MKNSKLGFALAIALLTAGTTIATKANFGKRVITSCFTQLHIKNVAGTIFSLERNHVSCTEARIEVALKPIVNSAIISTAIPGSTVCTQPGLVFCCTTVTEMLNTDPLYASAPFIDLGEGLRKYKIASSANVACHVPSPLSLP